MDSHSPFTCCPTCHRHIRTHEVVCPFCEKGVERVVVLPVALGLGAVALALTTAGCNAGCNTRSDPGQASVYGPAPMLDAGPPQDAAPPVVEVYGPPPRMDAGPPRR